MKFSRKEILELLKAWVAISIAFTILETGIVDLAKFGLVLGIMLFTVGIGFIFHELAHKFVAQRFHCWAEFRASNFWLILAIVLSFFGFIFAAPGYVAHTRVDERKNGIISNINHDFGGFY